jgi:hypothetical protein
MIAVQLIEVLWTKASRGAPHSTARNQVPRALPLLPCTRSFAFQHFRFMEWTGFEQQLVEERCDDETPREVHELRLSRKPDLSLWAGLAYSAETGLPARKGQRWLAEISGTCSTRLCTNGRHTDAHGSQHYRQATYNLFVTPDGGDRNNLVSTEPRRTFSMEANLW